MLIEKLYKQAEKRRHKLYPQHANRASSIGWPCLRFLVYSIVRWEDKELPSVELQLIFDEGNMQEKAMKRDLEAAGVEILQAQALVSFPEHRLYGSIDGVFKYRRGYRLIDFKTMSTNMYSKLNCLADFLLSKYPFHQCYPIQMNVYLKGMGLKKGVYFIKNKNNGQLKEIKIDYDNEVFKYALYRCDCVNVRVDKIRAILNEQYQIKEIADFKKRRDLDDYLEIREEACRTIETYLPERINELNICDCCPFKNICLPDEIRQGMAKIYTETAEFIEKLHRREELIEGKKEYTALDTEIKEYLKQRNESHFFIGDKDNIQFEINVKPHGKGLRVDIDKIITEAQTSLKFEE